MASAGGGGGDFWIGNCKSEIEDWRMVDDVMLVPCPSASARGDEMSNHHARLQFDLAEEISYHDILVRLSVIS